MSILENIDIDDKKDHPVFTPTVKIKISSPFINKTETAGTPVKFDCTDAMWDMHLRLRKSE